VAHNIGCVTPDVNHEHAVRSTGARKPCARTAAMLGNGLGNGFHLDLFCHQVLHKCMHMQMCAHAPVRARQAGRLAYIGPLRDPLQQHQEARAPPR